MSISIFKPISRHQKVLSVALGLCLPLLVAGCSERTEPAEENTETMTDSSNETILIADLTGEAEGDPEGSGNAAVTINSEDGEICYEIEVSGIEDPTMAHIHEGAEGESGGVVVDFNTPENGLSGCVEEIDSTLSDGIIQNPENFYVNVHNSDYPGGAVRGQLAAQP